MLSIYLNIILVTYVTKIGEFLILLLLCKMVYGRCGWPAAHGPVCIPMRSLSISSGRWRIVKRDTSSRRLRAILQISAMCRPSLVFGNPLTTMYASPIVSTLKTKRRNWQPRCQYLIESWRNERHKLTPQVHNCNAVLFWTSPVFHFYSWLRPVHTELNWTGWSLFTVICGAFCSERKRKHAFIFHCHQRKKNRKWI